MNWATIWPELWRQSPLAALMALALITGARGVWIFGNTYDAYVKQCEADKAEIRADRDQYKTIAFNSVGFLTERAQQSAKVNESVTNPESKKPIMATIKVPVTALTATEKKDIEKPKDAEPATLSQKLDATKKVLSKTEIVNAQPVKKP